MRLTLSTAPRAAVDASAYNEFAVENPKLRTVSRTSRDGLYPYYAGFAYRFARSILASCAPASNAVVLDPWNGSGTTTAAASDLELASIGFDLNPAMVVIAKARSLLVADKSFVTDPCGAIIDAASQDAQQPNNSSDPLGLWFTPATVAAIRGLDRAIQLVLFSGGYAPLREPARLRETPSLGAFFYVALFRTVRMLLQQLMASNPTWIRRNPTETPLLDPGRDRLAAIFCDQVAQMLPAVLPSEFVSRPSEHAPDIRVGSSQALPLADCSIDMAVSSPPYCTRIDYAVATTPELTVLGLDHDPDIQQLRRQLIGTTTVEREPPPVDQAWGPTCTAFLSTVRAHRSKASGTYYLKNHLQYFAGMYASLGEISRVLKPGGVCVLVVQDSYYKDIHNDLPTILTEMGGSYGLQKIGAVSFHTSQTLAGVNRRIDPYREARNATEQVLYLVRPLSDR